MAIEVLYISEDYLKENTDISSNVDINIIIPSISMAQDLFITKYIGKIIDSELKYAIQNNSLTTNQRELLNIIKKAQAQFTAHMAYVNIYARFLNKSANTPATEAGSTISKEDLIYIRDIAKNNGEFYLNQVGEFLIENKDLYPSFSDSCKPHSAYKCKIVFDEDICGCSGDFRGRCNCSKRYY